MAKQHENYKELIWVLAKTDFKLRYHGSVLGYIWAILSPLLLFVVLSFVFSSVFARGAGIKHYTLQLFVSLILFYFFQEGTNSGLSSLVSKASLVTKIYVPRWTIIIASTINAALIFLMNLIVVVLFFAWQGFLPGLASIGMFILFSFFVYLIVLGFSLLTAPLYVRFRDLAMIWQVIIRVFFYATPIIYPLQVMPEYIQRVLLVNPVAFIIHFNKEALINNHFPDLWQGAVFIILMILFFFISVFSYRKLIPKIAEDM